MLLKNYTTDVNFIKTVAEIEDYLAKMGAKRIMKEYSDGVITSLSFEIELNDRKIPVKLPARVDRVPAALRNIFNTDKDLTTSQRRLLSKAMKDKTTAINIAWRVIKDWLESNMSLMNIDQTNMMECLLPYTVVKNGKTMYELLEQSDFKFTDMASNLLEDKR